jgi:hypothetical protein
MFFYIVNFSLNHIEWCYIINEFNEILSFIFLQI